MCAQSEEESPSGYERRLADNHSQAVDLAAVKATELRSMQDSLAAINTDQGEK